VKKITVTIKGTTTFDEFLIILNNWFKTNVKKMPQRIFFEAF